MNIEARFVARTLVLELHGTLDAAVGDAALAQADAHLTPETRQVVADLQGLQHLDVAGARWLLQLRRHLAERSVQLRVVCPQGPLHQACDTAGIGRHLAVQENVELAVSGFDSPFRTSTESNGRVRVVFASGRLDVKVIPELEGILRRELDAGRRSVVLDLTEVSYLSSAGICSVLKYAKAFQQAHGKLVLTVPAGPAREILTLAGLSAVMPMLESLEESIWAAL